MALFHTGLSHRVTTNGHNPLLSLTSHFVQRNHSWARKKSPSGDHLILAELQELFILRKYDMIPYLTESILHELSFDTFISQLESS